jgi:hypothetical protein
MEIPLGKTGHNPIFLQYKSQEEEANEISEKFRIQNIWHQNI